MSKRAASGQILKAKDLEVPAQSRVEEVAKLSWRLNGKIKKINSFLDTPLNGVGTERDNFSSLLTDSILYTLLLSVGTAAIVASYCVLN